MKQKINVVEWIFDSSSKIDDICLVWIRSCDKNGGYGRYWYRGEWWKTYRLVVGPTTEGYNIRVWN